MSHNYHTLFNTQSLAEVETHRRVKQPQLILTGTCTCQQLLCSRVIISVLLVMYVGCQQLNNAAEDAVHIQQLPATTLGRQQELRCNHTHIVHKLKQWANLRGCIAQGVTHVRTACGTSV